MSLDGTLQQRWLVFAAATFPDDAPAYALEMLKASFYAGALAQIELESAITKDISNAEGAAYLARLTAEIKAFFEQHFTERERAIVKASLGGARVQ